MRITKLSINNYKSIKQPFSLNNLGNLHIFIGPNNAGKTNILDAIHQTYNRSNIRLNYKQTNLSINFKLRSKFGKVFTISQTPKKIIFKIDNKKISSDRAKYILGHHIIRLCATTPYNFSQLQVDYRYFLNKHPKIFKIFNDTLKKYFPEISQIKTPFKKKSIEEFGEIRPFERLGAGFQHVFVILMYLFHPQYTILLLEEPEIHLHPALVKKILKVIQNQNLDNQIFLTTHSTIFIQPTNLHRIFRVVKEDGSTKVFSPRIRNKIIRYNRLKQELNADNCEMFFADKVLLVEGPSDHLLMRGLIDRFYEGHKEIKVIQVYGKSNIDVYIELLDIFNIPYSVLLDRDALYDTGLKIVQGKINEDFAKPERSLILLLKKYNVYIFPNGGIEKNYPRKYQRQRKHKPLNALYASTHITKQEYNSMAMKNIKEVIDNL